MYYHNVKAIQNSITKTNSTLCVNRITALWALSESALGGVLHAFRIPFSGLFICGAAVIFISMIAYISEEKWAIMKSTLIVVLVKVIISPGTPINAHLAVIVQGFIGQILFITKNFPKTSALLLGILASLYSVIQKIIILTLVFGKTLWESIDQSILFVIQQFYPSVHTDIKFSYLLIGIYFLIHLIGGIAAGLIAANLPVWIHQISINNESVNKEDLHNDLPEESDLKKIKIKNNYKKKWWKRIPFLIMILFSITVIILSYNSPTFGYNKTYNILVMLLRSILVVLIWFSIIAPLILKLFRKLVAKKKTAYSNELNEIIRLFPHIKTIVNVSWKKSASNKGLKRIKYFLSYSFVYLILADLNT
jgi:hypothetical protein